MPAAFDQCNSQGGRVRTKGLSGDRYLRICIDKSGKSHPGYVKKKKTTRTERYLEKEDSRG